MKSPPPAADKPTPPKDEKAHEMPYWNQMAEELPLSPASEGESPWLKEASTAPPIEDKTYPLPRKKTLLLCGKVIYRIIDENKVWS